MRQTCDCHPEERTGGEHDPSCPEWEADCTCYEAWAGHQPGCPRSPAGDATGPQAGIDRMANFTASRNLAGAAAVALLALAAAGALLLGRPSCVNPPQPAAHAEPVEPLTHNAAAAQAIAEAHGGITP